MIADLLPIRCSECRRWTLRGLCEERQGYSGEPWTSKLVCHRCTGYTPSCDICGDERVSTFGRILRTEDGQRVPAEVCERCRRQIRSDPE